MAFWSVLTVCLAIVSAQDVFLQARDVADLGAIENAEQGKNHRDVRVSAECGEYYGAITANCTFIRWLTSGNIESRYLLPGDVCDPTLARANMKGKTAADLGMNGARSAYRKIFYAHQASPSGKVYQIKMDKSGEPLNLTVRASFAASAPEEMLLGMRQPRSGGRLYAVTRSRLYAAAPGSAAKMHKIADLSSLALSDASLVAAKATDDFEVVYAVDGDKLHLLKVANDSSVVIRSVALPQALKDGVVRIEPLIDTADLILALSDFPHKLVTVNVTSGAAETVSIVRLPTENRSATRAATMVGSVTMSLLDSQGLLLIGIDDGYKTGMVFHELTPVDTEDIIDTFHWVI